MALPKDEFEIQGNLARCRICADSVFTKFSNARVHAQSKKHQFATMKTPRTLPPIQVTNNADSCDLIGSAEPDDRNNSPPPIEPDEDPDIFPSPPIPNIPLPSIHSLINETQDRVNSILQEFENLGIPIAPPQEEMAPDTGISPWTFESETQETPNDDEEIYESEFKKYRCSKGDWAPYPTKAMFLTDVLFNSPRLRFSEAQKKAILQWARDLGANDIPNLHALKMCQNELNEVIGNPTTEKNTRNGNIFYLNEIGAAITKDFSNPNVRPHMNFYPERSSVISQMWHASKWHTDLSVEYQMPMAVHPNTGIQFYIGELCQTFSNHMFIPKRWFQLEGSNVYCAGFEVLVTEMGLIVQRNNEIKLRLLDLQYNYLQLTQAWKPIFAECSTEDARLMPSPKRVKAEGRPFFFVYVMIFIDDVSGNVSKQWNKHYVCYMSNSMLPREHIDKEFNVRYVTSSPSVNALELAQGIRESFEKSQKGAIAYDCVLREEIMFEAIPFLIAADNPMHAELASSCGLTSNKFCRTCEIGGPQAFKRSDAGYLTLFKTATLRAPTNTRNAIMQQFLRVLQPNPRTAVENLVKESGVKDILAQPLIDSLMDLSYSLYGANEKSSEEIQEQLNAELRNLKSQGRIQNAFLEMKELDVHLDTPTEILHTILLGIVKYFWGQTVYLVIKEKKFDIFQARLQTVSSDGLSVPQIMAGYLCQYRGALIGKHFKTIVQIMPSIIYDLVHQDLLDAWLLMGRLTVLCWHTVIRDIDLYVEELEDVIEQFLTKTAVCAPPIIVTKPKFHFLVHLPLYVRRFGPALLFATERFESFNSVFRSSSVHSNHLAPSRDISTTFSQLDRVKHITSGGWWYDEDLKKYVCASPHVPNFILRNPEYAKLVGLNLQSKKPAGTMAVMTKQVRNRRNERVSMPYDRTLAAHIQQDSLNISSLPVLCGNSIVVRNGDLAKIGSAVMFVKAGYKVALVRELLQRRNEVNQDVSTLVTLQIFELGVRRHNLLDLPLLQKTDEYCIIAPNDILCVVNIQHDCARFKCPVTGSRSIYQERQQTTRTQAVVHHEDDRHFILNSLSLHNYQEIQSFLTQTPLPARKYYNSTEHNVIRTGKAAELRDKKQQANEAKSSKEREVLLGRAEKESGSQTAVPLETNAMVSSTRITPMDPFESQVVGTELEMRDNPSLLPEIEASTEPILQTVLLQAPAPEPTKKRKQMSKKTEASGAKKTSRTRSGKKQDMIGLGSSTGPAVSQARKRGKTKLTKEQIAANEKMLCRDVFDV